MANSPSSNITSNFITKICAVCGDNAVGTNFGVTSCESCKAFYRRNNMRKSSINCPFQGNCVININSRKNCQACRLQKCMSVGMKKDGIIRDSHAKRNFKIKGNNDIKGTRHKRHEIPSTATKKGKVNEIKEESFDIVNQENDNINISKEDYFNLVNKIKQLENHLYQRQVHECICFCQCGYYPPNTKFSNILRSEEEKIKSEMSKATTNISIERNKNEEFSKSTITQKYINNNIISSGPNNIQQSQVDYYHNVLLTKKNNINDCDKKNIINNIQLPLSYFNSSNVEDFVNKSVPSGSNHIQQFSFNHITKSSIPMTPLSPDFFQNSMHIDSQISSILGHEPKYQDTCLKKAPSFITPPPSIVGCTNSNPNMSGYFENWEMELLSELIKSNTIMKEPVNINQISGSNEFSLHDIVEFTNLAFRRTIQMSKMISLFKQLAQNDQMALVKGGASEILILRGAMVYDVTKGGWKHYAYQGASDIMIKIDVLKNSSEQSYYLKHKMFLETFNERWRKSEEVMLLLNVLVLFNTTRPNLENISGVIAANFVYKHILKKYVSYQCFNEEEAQREFDHLMNKLNELEELNKGLVSIYSLFTVNDLDPLLIELFDLK